jgi:hypothetical protein
VFGCTDSLGYNYDTLATINNGDCLMLHPGELIHGGMVFYVDESGQHGLVVSLENIGYFPWRCSGINIPGASGTNIGSGLQNSLDIISGCENENTPAFLSLNFTTEVYTDWYFPSKGELLEMYYTIGNGCPDGNIGGFSNSYYWSSSETGSGSAFTVNFSNGGESGSSNKLNPELVRIIRAF